MTKYHKVPLAGPHHLPKFWYRKPKATTKVTLQEPPIIDVFFTCFHVFDMFVFCLLQCESGSALHEAALFGKLEVVKLLLRHGKRKHPVTCLKNHLLAK